MEWTCPECEADNYLCDCAAKKLREDNVVKIGQFYLSPSQINSKDSVVIFCEDGEGGEFKISELEKVIKKFYEENF